MAKKLLSLFLLILLALPLAAKSEATLFARIVPDREQVYAGDSMLVSVVIYSSLPIAQAQCSTDFKIKGKCKVRKLNINRDATAGRTREGRNIYYTLVWNQYVVAPQQVGSFTIPAQKFKATLQQVVRMPDIFDQMMGARPEYKEVSAQGGSDSFTFEVKEKPLRSTQEMMQSGKVVL